IQDSEILYTTGEKEAQTIEETLLGVVYVTDMIAKAGLKLRQMDDKGADFINNWESEKYRSQQLK
ncbi:MAG: class II aldolase, partial [Bacillota bacterium]